MKDCFLRKTKMELEKELKYYESIKDELLKHHEGKFALIKKDKLINTFTKMEEAYENGVKNFGTEPFLIKKITKEETIESIPSLMTGAISASI